MNLYLQLTDKDSLLNVFKKLLHLRKNNQALHSGKIEIVHTGNKNILAFVRSFEEEKLVVLINFCNSKVTVNINLPIKEMVFSIGQKNGFNGVLKGFSGIIVKL